MKKFPAFGLGALHFGSLLTPNESKEIIECALKNGITFFDTSPLYGKGLSEEILGDVLSKIREEVFVCTKAGLKVSDRSDGRFGVEVERLTEENLSKSVDRSLMRLKRNSIDMLMLHAFDAYTPFEETLAALQRLYQQGKIKSFGCSNYNPRQLQLLLKHTQNNPPFLAAQCHFNMIERRAEKAFIPLCIKNNVTIVVNRALARGALSGQYGTNVSIPENSRAAKSIRIQKWLDSQKLSLLDSLNSIAKDSQIPLAIISLKWLLKNHPQMLILLGVRNRVQLEKSMSALSADVSDSVLARIEMAVNKGPNVFTSPPRYFEK